MTDNNDLKELVEELIDERQEAQARYEKKGDRHDAGVVHGISHSVTKIKQKIKE